MYACVCHLQVRELKTLVVKIKKDEEVTAPFPFVDLKKCVFPFCFVLLLMVDGWARFLPTFFGDHVAVSLVVKENDDGKDDRTKVR